MKLGLRSAAVGALVYYIAACGSTDGNDAGRGGAGGSGAGSPPGGTTSGAGASTGGGGHGALGSVAGAAGHAGDFMAGAGGEGAAEGGSSGAGGGSAGSDGLDGMGGEAGSGPLCRDEAPTPAPLSSDCSMAQLGAAELQCPDATTCPVEAAWALHCDAWGYGPWVATAPSNAAFIGLFTAVGQHSARVFDLGTAQVRSVPAFDGDPSIVAVDANGEANVFGGIDYRPARARLSDGDAALSTGSEELATPNAMLAIAAHARDADNSFLAYAGDGGWPQLHPFLATQRNGCWTTQKLAAKAIGGLALDVDSRSRPWVAWYDDQGDLAVWGPDAKVHTVSTGNEQVQNFWWPPRVLADGLNGSSDYPALGSQQPDGIHVSSRANGQGSWTDRILPGSVTRQIGGDCPPLSPSGPDVCGGLKACTEQYRGAPRGFGLARTQSGRAYAVWLDETADVSYSLAVPSSCGSPCYCDRRITAASGHVDVVLARVEDAPTAPRIVRRIRLETGGAIQLNQLVVTMAARSETLHIVASVGISSAEPTFDARYLRVNAAALE